MSSESSPDLSSPRDLRRLVEQWRIDAEDAKARGYVEACNERHVCANELSAALASATERQTETEPAATERTGAWQPMERTCEWHCDDADGDAIYETQCKHAFQFNDGGPVENEFQFCGYCGGRLVETRTSDADTLPASPAPAGGEE